MNNDAMLRLLLVIGLSLSISHTIKAQIFVQPHCEITVHDFIQITKIVRSDEHTAITLECTAPSIGLYACIEPHIYIRDVATGKRYKLLRTKDIPICPEPYLFTRRGETLSFTVYFQPLPATTRLIDLIENSERGFTFFKVHLIQRA